MAQALIFNGTAGRVDIPTKVGSGGARRLLLAEFLSVSDFSNRCIVGNSLSSTDGSIRFISTTQLGVRINGGSERTVTVSPAFQTATEFTLEVFVNVGNTVSVNVNSSQVGSAAIASTEFSAIDNYQYIGQCGNSFRLNATVKRMVVLTTEYINLGDNTATTWGDGTLNGLTPPGCWTFFEAGGGTAYSIVADTVTDSHTANDVTLTYSGAATAYTLTADTVSDTHAAGDVTLTYSAAGTATITSEPLKDNTGALLAGQPLDYVAIYDGVTGALVLRVTGISTNASGVFSVSDAALTAGVTYKLDWKVTIQSAARMPAKAAV